MSTSLYDPIKSHAKVTDSVLVAFSGGKDSIVTLDLCMRYFKRVQPFFMYMVPDLGFQEETLGWYEKKYDTEIIRIPHFEVSTFMRYGTFREPDFNVSEVSVKETYDYLRNRTGIFWISAGERISDSTIRRAMIKHSGTIDAKRGRFYPIANWSKKNVLDYIRLKHLKLPRDSKRLGFSFRSLDGKQLAAIQDMYPDDYQKILKVYPFADAATERYRRYGK